MAVNSSYKKSYNFFKNFGKIASSSNLNPNAKKNLKLSFYRNKDDGTLRLYKQFSLRELKPTKRILFKEPDFHLKFISNILRKYKKLFYFTFTYKDFSLAEICCKKNTSKILFLSKYLKLNFLSNIDETIDRLFSKKIKLHKKKDSVIILRHVWEHVYDHKKLLIKIFKYCSTKSVFYIEVPDSYRQIKSLDYSILWEDHVYYFDKIGFVNNLNAANLKVLDFYKFKQKYEDIYCAICIYDKNFQYKVKKSPNMLKCTSRYKDYFSSVKIKMQKKFQKLYKDGEIISFGASHMLNTFVGLFNLEKYFSYIVDDNKTKQNKFMFSTSTKIFPFSKISLKFPKNCLVSINPSNKEIMKKIKYLKLNKVKIQSIFDK